MAMCASTRAAAARAAVLAQLQQQRHHAAHNPWATCRCRASRGPAFSGGGPTRLLRTAGVRPAQAAGVAPATAASSGDRRPPAGKQPPRFYAPELPSSLGAAVELEPEEARHAVRVLRLRPGDPVELCDGRGGLAQCELASADRNTATVVATGEPRREPWLGPRWVVAAGCLTLKGGREDWLVEKAAELGAEALLPLLTERSQTGTTRAKFRALRGGGQAEAAAAAGGQPGRVQRLALAATKQSLRAHGLRVEPPATLEQLLPRLRQSPLALVATAGAPPVLGVLQQQAQRQQQAGDGALPWDSQQCFLLVGPEGDFTRGELEQLDAAGVLRVGLGPHRLRTETAALALLCGAALASDAVAAAAAAAAGGGVASAA